MMPIGRFRSMYLRYAWANAFHLETTVFLTPDLAGFEDFLAFGGLLTGGGLHGLANDRGSQIVQRVGAITGPIGVAGEAVAEEFVPQSKVELAFAAWPPGRLGGRLVKSFKFAVKKLGIDPRAASRALHRVKGGPSGAGRRGPDNLLFDTETGDIVSPQTGEVLGNLRDG
jgi:hypothetical protein